jgi:hypothetical protein
LYRCYKILELSHISVHTHKIYLKEGIRERKMPPCHEEEDVVHILIEFPETRKLREHFLSRK